MAPGLPDLVDCARLAEEKGVLQRVYGLGDLPRLADLLAEPAGTLSASFAFKKLASGGAGAEVSIAASPRLVCQRCLQAFGLELAGGSEIEFAAQESGADGERETVGTRNGLVSLRDLAEEELLLALPLAPKCSTPLTCGNAPRCAAFEDLDGKAGEEPGGPAGGAPRGPGDDVRRPFSGLKDLLKKT